MAEERRGKGKEGCPHPQLITLLMAAAVNLCSWSMGMSRAWSALTATSLKVAVLKDQLRAPGFEGGCGTGHWQVTL